jgi:hypothetical protein
LFKQKIVAGEKETLSKELRSGVECPFVSLDREKGEKIVMHFTVCTLQLIL